MASAAVGEVRLIYTGNKLGHLVLFYKILKKLVKIFN